MLKLVQTQNTIALRRANNSERVLANLNAIGLSVSEHFDIYSDSFYLNCVYNPLYTACWNPVNCYLGKQWGPRQNDSKCCISSGSTLSITLGKQWRPRCNATKCGISSGSALFAKIKR